MGFSPWSHLDCTLILKKTKTYLIALIQGRVLRFHRFCVSDFDDYETGDADLTLSIRDRVARRYGLATE